MAPRDKFGRGGRSKGREEPPKGSKASKPTSDSSDSDTLVSPTHGQHQARGPRLTSPNRASYNLNALIESPFFKHPRFLDAQHTPSSTGFTSDYEQGGIPLRTPSQHAQNPGPYRPRNFGAALQYMGNGSGNDNGSGNSNGNGNGSGNGFRTSRTWMSPDVQYARDFTLVRNAMRRQFRHSDVAKWGRNDYIAHCEAVVDSNRAQLSRMLQQKELERDLEIPALTHLVMNSLARLPGQKNLTMHGNIGRVLGEKTIWCQDWMRGKDEISPWPSQAELKWEGDDRAKTGVGRFPPLPREPGTPSIPWNQLQVIEQYPIDQIARIPTMEDIYLPVDEVTPEDTYLLITHNLEDAMDAYLES